MKLSTSAKSKSLVACQSCRRRKVKCSSGKPCLACKLSATDCIYDVVLEPFATSGADNTYVKIPIEVAEHIRQLENTVQQLRDRLRERPERLHNSPNHEVQITTTGQPGKATVGSFITTTRDSAGCFTFFSECQRQTLFPLLFTVVQDLLGDSEQYRKFCKSALKAFSTMDTSQTTDSPSNHVGISDTDVAYTQFCQNTDDLMQCATLYFQSCNNIFPIIIEAEWLETYDPLSLLTGTVDTTNKTAEELEICITMTLIVALGSHLKFRQLPGQPGSIGLRLFNNARSWWQSLSVPESRISSVQCSLLLEFYHERSNQSRSAALSANVSARLIQLLGLHRADHSMLHLRQKELNISLFWSFFVSDASMIWTSGHIMSFCGSTYDQHMPSLVSTAPVVQRDPGALIFYALCLLSELTLHAWEMFYAPLRNGASSQTSLRTRLENFNLMRLNVCSKLPDEGRPRALDEHQAYSFQSSTIHQGPPSIYWTGVHLLYYHAIIQAYRRVLIDTRPGLSSTQMLRENVQFEDWENEARDLTLAASRCILQASPLVSIGDPTIQTSMGFEFHMVNTALVVILVEAVVRPQYPGTDANLGIATETLQRLMSLDCPISSSPAHLAAVAFIARILDIANLAFVNRDRVKR